MMMNDIERGLPPPVPEEEEEIEEEEGTSGSSSPPPPPFERRESSWQVFRHWIDPTVKSGGLRRCLSCSCKLGFAKSIFALLFTLIGVTFAIATLIYYEFDVPNGGTAICWGLISASLAAWFKPTRIRTAF